MAGAIWGALALVFSDPAERTPWIYRTVLTLGYGHLVGGALLGRRGIAGRWGARIAGSPLGALPPRLGAGLAAGLGCAAVAFLYSGYTAALDAWPIAAGVLLAIATWHSAENDLALPLAYRNGLRLPPVSSDADTQAAALGITALVLGLAAAALAADPVGGHGLAAAGPDAFAGIVPGMRIDEALLAARCAAALAGCFLLRGRSAYPRERLGLGLVFASAVDPAWLCAQTALAFADVFALSTLYHLASWWVLSAERSRVPRSSPNLTAEVAAVHALPALMLGAAWVLPTEHGARLAASLLSPAPYLFWSLGHVIQTAGSRRRIPPRERHA